MRSGRWAAILENRNIIKNKAFKKGRPGKTSGTIALFYETKFAGRGETVTIKVKEANPKGEADWKLLSTCSAPQSASRRRSVMRCARAIEGRSPEFRSHKRMSR